MSSDSSAHTLRGIACILLVLYHVVGASPSFGLRVDGGDLRSVNDALAVLRMPLFTVLSGYFYGLRPAGPDSIGFLKAKARRLLVPMLVAGTALALAQAWAPGVNAAPRNWALLHLVPVGHLWFVESLCWVFAAVVLLERAGLLHDPARFAPVLLGAAAVHLGVPGVHWLGIDGALYLLPYFLAGLAMRRFALTDRARDARIALGLAAVALVALAALGPPAPDVDRRTPAMLVAGLSLCALLMAAQPRHAGLARLGAASYAIYLYHVFFTAPVRIALETLGAVPLPVHVAAGVTAGLAGPCVIRRFARRRVWSRWLLLGDPAPAKPAGVARRSASQADGAQAPGP